jgi:hypothetical protein
MGSCGDSQLQNVNKIGHWLPVTANQKSSTIETGSLTIATPTVIKSS